MEEKHNLNVSMRPEFVQAFQNCMSFSCKYNESIDGGLRWERACLTFIEVLV